MSNFLVEVAVNRESDNLGPMDGAPIVAVFATNNVLEFTDYLTSARDYFGGMVKFDSDVKYVSILVQAYRDHHVISMDRDTEGKFRIRTNQ
jgi:hypothetical protein